MSKADKLKEEIGWLKVVFALLVATDISLIAWLAQNYTKAGLLSSASCALAVVVVTGAVVWVNHTAYAKIDELEDL
jgi:4-hydroxybenzoate polyprenyltransferase